MRLSRKTRAATVNSKTPSNESISNLKDHKLWAAVLFVAILVMIPSSFKKKNASMYLPRPTSLSELFITCNIYIYICIHIKINTLQKILNDSDNPSSRTPPANSKSKPNYKNMPFNKRLNYNNNSVNNKTLTYATIRINENVQFNKRFSSKVTTESGGSRTLPIPEAAPVTTADKPGLSSIFLCRSLGLLWNQQQRRK